MLKNLKSLFIIEESEQETEKKDANQDSGAANPNPASPQNTKPRTSSKEGIIDSKIIEKLLHAVEKNNLDGFDYLEYKKSLKALEKIPMDEATRYRSAFATASTMDVTLNKLLETTNFYLGVLEKENEQFLSALKNQFNAKVSGGQQEISKFQSLVKEKSAQIKKLTEEIAKFQEQISTMEQEVEESNAKIEKTQNDFKRTYLHLRGQFETDKEKMQKYLK
ncbi:MAG: hypothetical protein AAGL34_02380 [Bacteroidota bacterium]